MRKKMNRVFSQSSPDALKKRVSELQENLLTKEALLDSVSEGSLALQVQLEIYQGKSAQLTSDNLFLKEKIKALEQAHVIKDSELAALGKLVLKSEETSVERSDQLKKVNATLENTKKELLKAKADLEASNKKLKNTELDFHSFKESQGKSQKSLEAELIKVKAQLVQEKENSKSTNNRLNETQDNLNARFSELAKLTNMIEVYERKLMSKDSELSVYKQQLDKLKDSFSWKAAAPARVLSKKFKKKSSNGLLNKHIEMVEKSGFFNIDWYGKNCPELDRQSLSPIEHYLTIGYKIGLSPSERFNGNDYLERYPDVQQEGVNPLLHYLMFGKNEGRII